MELIVNDSWGIYVPQRYAQKVGFDALTGVDEDTWRIIQSGPDHEEYWWAWDYLITSAVYTSHDGRRYTLYQDGDLWHIPVDENN